MAKNKKPKTIILKLKVKSTVINKDKKVDGWNGGWTWV